jgi:ABC-type lipoprotein export system ATPase subunit
MKEIKIIEAYKYSIVGMSGSGKTTLLIFLSNLLDFEHIIIIDPVNRFTNKNVNIYYKGIIEK